MNEDYYEAIGRTFSGYSFLAIASVFLTLFFGLAQTIELFKQSSFLLALWCFDFGIVFQNSIHVWNNYWKKQRKGGGRS